MHRQSRTRLFFFEPFKRLAGGEVRRKVDFLAQVKDLVDFGRGAQVPQLNLTGRLSEQQPRVWNGRGNAALHVDRTHLMLPLFTTTVLAARTKL
ncbi:hypothetical protein [Caenimonas koreensis]|uniref:hypothetical protein n=1 Tax=Caenimonas koreensis TaxID=367474 RepID=UPI0037842F24